MTATASKTSLTELQTTIKALLLIDLSDYKNGELVRRITLKNNSGDTFILLMTNGMYSVLLDTTYNRLVIVYALQVIDDYVMWGNGYYYNRNEHARSISEEYDLSNVAKKYVDLAF